MPRHVAAMRVISAVGLGDLAGDNRFLAMSAVAPCCAAFGRVWFKESLLSVTEVSSDLQICRAFSCNVSSAQRGIQGRQ